jgi:hypothetical protein
MRNRGAIAVIVGLLLALGLPGATPTAGASATNPAADEAEFVALLNGARAAAGLPALEVDAQLTGLARDWATHMAEGNCPVDPKTGEPARICHASPISAGVTAKWQKLGENVGTGPSVQPVMDAFMNSPGHKANILDPAFTRVGVGVVWSGNALYTTHRFMKVAGDTTAPAPEPDPEPAPPPAPKPKVTAPPTTTAPPPPPVPTTVPPPPPPPATPSRVAVVLLALRSAGA